MSLRDVYESGFDEEPDKTITANACPECPGDLITDGGEILCAKCGLIVDEQRLDRGPEWTDFDDSNTTQRRTGAPLTLGRHDRGLSTEIGHGGDANGNTLSSQKRRQIARLRKRHNRARWQSKADRNLAHACGEIARIVSALELPRIVREEASRIYREAQAANLIRGRSVETIAAGSVYGACRCAQYERSLSDIATVAQCDEHKVKLGYRVLNMELGLDAAVTSPRERIPRFASECNASEHVEHRAGELAVRAEEAGLANGRKPSGVAAACLYLASQEFEGRYTQSELAAIADVTPVTLRDRYYELMDVIDEE